MNFFRVSTCIWFAFCLLGLFRLLFLGTDKELPYGYPLYIFYEPMFKNSIGSYKFHGVIVVNFFIDILCSVILGMALLKVYYLTKACIKLFLPK